MNAIDLYKKLPKKNCGKCRQKTCMSFSISIIKGDAELNECSELSDTDISALKNSIVIRDWREELISSLQTKMKNVDLSNIPADLGGIFSENRLKIRCLGRDLEVTPDGEIFSKDHLTPWIKILILHYIINHGKGEITGKWVSFSELRSGMVKASSFRRECEEPLRELFDNNSDRVEQIIKMLGAESSNAFPSDKAWVIYLLPKLPVAVLYWTKDAEFTSKVTLLFDSTADRFLDVESLMFLLEGFVKNIEMAIAHGSDRTTRKN